MTGKDRESGQSPLLVEIAVFVLFQKFLDETTYLARSRGIKVLAGLYEPLAQLFVEA